MSVKMSNRENVKLSLESIASNKLRTFLTALIIAIGITALVGILTSIDAIQNSLKDSFSAMGANSFNIRNRGINVQIGGSGTRPKVFKKISYREALAFQKKFDYGAIVSISAYASNFAVVKYGSEQSNPNISILGGDDHYLQTGGYKLESGRNFTQRELETGSNVVIIGSEIKKRLFKERQDPLNKMLVIGNAKYLIIGVLEDKGSSAGMGADKTCIIPLLRARAVVQGEMPSYTITVMSSNAQGIDPTIGEATALFR